MRPTPPPHLRLALALLLGALGLPGLALLPSPAAASCNFHPGTVNEFRGAVGSADRPFAAPGDLVSVGPSSSGCPLGGVPQDEVLLLFVPPEGPSSAVLLSSDCASVPQARLDACAADLPGFGGSAGMASCLPLVAVGTSAFEFPDTSSLVADQNDDGDRVLSGPAKIVGTHSSNPLPCTVSTTRCGDLTPADLTAQGINVCIDEFFPIDGTCRTDAELVDPAFPHFTALPKYNQFDQLCTTDGVCSGESSEIQFTTDSAGNILAPIDWSGVLVRLEAEGGGVIPVPRLVTGESDVVAFADEMPGQPVVIPGDSFIHSFSPQGHALPPIFTAFADATALEAEFFGSVDAPLSVTRIKRRGDKFGVCSNDAAAPCNESSDCPSGGTCVAAGCYAAASLGDRPAPVGGPSCTGDADCGAAQECGPSLFEFRDRFQGEGCGPVEAAFTGTADNVVTVDNLFLPQTPDLLLIAHDEPLEEQLSGNLEGGEPAGTDADFNMDGNLEGDVSLTTNARKSGQVIPLGLGPVAGPLGADGIAVPRIADPPYRFPAVAAEGPVVALLQFEATDFDEDFDANGRVEDTLLRVYRLGSAGPINPTTPADAGPVIAGRSLAVVDGLVFYRASEPGRAARTTALSSVDSAGNEGDEPSIEVGAISPDGRFVAFTSTASNLTADAHTPGRLHVYVHDRDTDADGVFDEPGATLTERVSEAFDGTEANGDSGSGGVAITPNGNTVVFTSLATNLDVRDTSATQSIYVFNRLTHGIELVSSHTGGASSFDGFCTDPDISDDGIFVAFSGRRTGPADVQAVYLRELGESTLEEISRSGITLHEGTATRISGDGRFVVFQSASALGTAACSSAGDADVYLHDREAPGVTETFCLSYFFGTNSRPPGEAILPTISEDGFRVAFLTDAAFDPQDTNGTWDVYVTALDEEALQNQSQARGTHLLASRSPEGCQSANAALLRPALSPDGRYVAFGGDLDELELVGDCPMAPVASDGVPQLYVHDLVTGDTVVRSRGEDGFALTSADVALATQAPGLTRNALHATFATAESLVTGDGNGVADAHVEGVASADAAADLDGDGAPEDLVLEVFDTLVDTVDTLGPATQVDVSESGHAAFLCPGDGGPAGPVCLYQNRGAVTNLGRNATEVALSDEIVAALISESPTTVETHPVGAGGWSEVAGGTEAELLCGATGSLVVFATAETADVTGDGSADALFLQVYDAAADTLTQLPWPEGFGPGSVSAASCVMGPDVDRCTGDTGVSCSDDSECGGGWCDGTCQSLGAVCEGDGDCAAGETCEVATLVAIETREADLPGTWPDIDSCNLNGDGFCDDQVLLVYDTLTGKVHNSGQSIIRCVESACDPRALYLVGEDSVRFLTNECAQGTQFGLGNLPNAAPGCLISGGDGPEPTDGTDLNDDGVSGQLIVQEFKVRSGGVTALGIAQTEAAGSPLNPLGGDPDENLLFTEAGVCAEPTAPATPCTSSDQCAPGDFCTAQLGVSPGECARDRGACVPCLGDSADCTLNPECPDGSTCTPTRMVIAAGDFDRDGVPDPVGPRDPDTGLPVGGDNCPTVPNPEQIDTDGDGIGDACDGLTCGNGIRELDEQCDDGNLVDDDSCANDCTWNYIEIAIDIKVGSDENPINLTSSVVPVAVLTTPSFDVATLDVDSLCFGLRPPDPTSLVCMGDDTEKHGKGHFGDVEGDGDEDVELHFDTDETGITSCSVEACLTGQTVDGIPVLGCDAITTTPPCGTGGGGKKLRCGMGVELALVVPPLWWLIGRRRRRS